MKTKSKLEPPRLTAEEAQLLCEVWDIEHLLGNEEECEMLERNAPEQLAVYEKLKLIADAG